MTSWIEADQVAERLEPGMTVFVAGTGAEPRALLEALSRHGDRCAGVRFVSVPIPGINGIDFSSYHADTRSTAFFATPENRDSIASGRVDFVPLQYRAIFDYLAHDLPVDVVMLQLPSVEGANVMSLGIWADFVPAVLDKAGLVIGEINTRQPAPADAPTWPLARLDLAVACDLPVPVFPIDKIDTAARKIARHVAELIRDGDCIQIGIGAIPSAVLGALTQKNDLGIQSGMITDGVMALTEAGNITGRYKHVDTGKIVTGTTLGSEALIEWAGIRPELRFRPVSHTHDVSVIRQIDNFVSINSALEVDLFGQVNADMLAGRQMSGTGGSVDMMRGAALSRGGRSIIALHATAASGEKSRIVTALPAHTAATVLRTDVDYVVTEYGARRIRHLSTTARTKALIEIAAPQFRDQLGVGPT
jgi:4-hydroxybutyrate CoA-transferase